MQLAACVIPALALLPMTASAADVGVMEDIIAKVNGDIVTLSELRQGAAVADRVDQLLLIQRGADLDINVDWDVSRRIARLQQQAGAADPDKFAEFIRENTGMSPEDFRQQIRSQEIIERVIAEEVVARIRISRAELRREYDAHSSDYAVGFEEVENQIAGLMYRQAFEPKLREYLTELRRKVFLRIKQGYRDDAAAPDKDTTWGEPAQLRPERVTRDGMVPAARHRKRLLWLAPLPGTEVAAVSRSK